MTNQQTSPADVMGELDEVIEAADSELENPDIDATALAIQMAKDFGVDLAEVEGTGKEGRITVPDVEKFIKAAEAETEAEASADPATDEPVAEETKPKSGKKTTPKRTGEAAVAPFLPNIQAGLLNVYHIMRSVGEFGFGDWYQPTVSVQDADENIGNMLSDGWSLLHTQTLGYGPDGIEMFWVLGRFAENQPPREYQYREIHHVTRRVGEMGDDGRGITGVAANALIDGYLQDGWDLAFVEALDKSAGGTVNMMWILVR